MYTDYHTFIEWCSLYDLVEIKGGVDRGLPGIWVAFHINVGTHCSLIVNVISLIHY